MKLVCNCKGCESERAQATSWLTDQMIRAEDPEIRELLRRAISLVEAYEGIH